MRWALVILVLLAPASTARADVFVPADPALPAVDCLSAAGDVLAGMDQSADVIVASEAGSQWRPIASAARLTTCPVLAAASDDTAALTAGSKVLVRRAGGAFGAPVELGSGLQPADVAAAPGGWVAVISERRRELIMSTIAPDGAITSRQLDHGDRTFLSPRIDIDAHGVATAVWTRWNSISGLYSLRTSGGPVGTGTDPVYDFPSRGQIDVAVSPSGHRLLAWADGRGVHASIDGGPARRLAVGRNAGSPTAAIADDGAAVVGYVGRRGSVFVIDRTASADWSSPRTLSRRSLYPSDGPVELETRSVIGADGRATVAWRAAGDVRWRVFAATGIAGGAWGPAAGLSQITRDADEFALGPAGVVWTESSPERSDERLRGARLASTAADLTAPVVTARLPRRTRRTTTGRVTLRVPVRCSEVCDVRLRLLDRRDHVELAGVTRRVAGRVTMRLRVPSWAASDILITRRKRTPRLELLVTDRAGNVVHRSRTLRFRIVERPLLAYRVSPNHDFAMFSRAGNRAVARLVNETIEALAAHEITSGRELRRRFQRGLSAIERHHGEVFDTDVLDEIFTAVQVPFGRAGYDAEDVLSA
jgi:hypothetical protein